MANIEIRQKMLINGIKSYQLAEVIGINQSTMSVWLRTELNEERLNRVEIAFKQLIKDY